MSVYSGVVRVKVRNPPEVEAFSLIYVVILGRFDHDLPSVTANKDWDRTCNEAHHAIRVVLCPDHHSSAGRSVPEVPHPESDDFSQIYTTAKTNF